MTSIIISEWLRLLVEEMVQGVKFKETEVMKRTVAFIGYPKGVVTDLHTGPWET